MPGHAGLDDEFKLRLGAISMKVTRHGGAGRGGMLDYLDQKAAVVVRMGSVWPRVQLQPQRPAIDQVVFQVQGSSDLNEGPL